MKNVRFFANVVKTVAACVVMGLSFTGCQKDDLADHSNKEEGKAKLTITDEPKPGPKPVLSDSLYAYFRGDSLIVRYDSLRNDTIFKSDSTSIKFSANVKRNDDERQTTSARLEYPNMDFTFNAAQNKQNGKMEFFGTQTGSDEDGQEYTVTLNSGKTSFHGWNNVHFILKGTKLVRFDNEKLTPKSTESVRVNSTMKWNLTVGIENVPGFDKELIVKANETSHERYILKNAPTLKWREWDIDSLPGNWKTEWTIKCVEHWSNDSTATKQKNVTLKGSYWKIDLSDKVVGSFEYSHPTGDLNWGAWSEIDSKDANVKLYEKKGTKVATATNGIDSDKFNTEFGVSVQKADVTFCDSLIHLSADEATLTNQRNVFVDEASDRDGYSMVRFTDTEVAKWNGEYEQKLDESCKLYLKLAEPEIIDYILVDGSDYKTRTENSVKVGLTIKPKYKDGTFGKEIPFKMERAESWTWLKDSVIYEGIEFFMQETAEKLELVGDLKKTAKTQKDNGGVFSFNEYEADFRATVKSNGMTKYTTWHAIWSEDFTFTYTDENGKTFSHTFNKSDYNVKAQNASLKKNESKSSVTSEVYDYSVDGIFAIDNVTRSAKGYGRFQKKVDERVTKTYWDEASKGQSHTVLESTRWATLIREYNTGKKTTQEYKHVFNRLSGSSKWEITAEEGSEAANGSMILENANEENRADDFAHFSLKKFELGQFFNVPGAAQQHDKVTFTESMGAYFEAKDQDGNAIKIFFEDPSYSFTNDVKALTVKSESDSETVYQHENVVNWNFGGATTTLSATGLIHVAKSQETPDFDIEVGSIFASVSRPSNRNGVNGDITAYTYLLVSKDGKKCLPLGIYNNIVTVGEITNMQAGFNSACYVLNENKVVATACTLNNGIIKYKDANGTMVDGGMFIEWQSAGFNNRGNSFENWQHKYAPKATKKGNVTVVTFEGTNVSYTFRGWNV